MPVEIAWTTQSADVCIGNPYPCRHTGLTSLAAPAHTLSYSPLKFFNTYDFIATSTKPLKSESPIDSVDHRGFLSGSPTVTRVKYLFGVNATTDCILQPQTYNKNHYPQLFMAYFFM